MTHFIEQCSCGNVIAQCRCAGPHKEVRIIPHPACGREPPVRLAGIRLAIVGATCLGAHPEAMRVIEERLARREVQYLVSGGAPGIDTLAEVTALRLGKFHPMYIFRPTVWKWGAPGGFRERNHQIALACDELLRLSCKRSSTYGSGWTRDQVAAMGKPAESIELDCGRDHLIG